MPTYSNWNGPLVFWGRDRSLRQSSSHKAFLLTRQWLETNAGLELVFWFISDTGPLRMHLKQQEAVCFFSSEQIKMVEKILSGQKGWRIAATELTNFASDPISACIFPAKENCSTIVID
ncbi:MAG: hypothetical protein CM1200mP40_15300 [Gammaproteobacteria bacterium]|nr:MAG: hypothetical protein CM1200mP40_15300 [Gammaproteobacteria bacterium]